MPDHRLAEERSLEYHRAVAEALRSRPELVERARQRVAGWLAASDVHPFYSRAWRDALDGSVDDLCALLVERSERAAALRQMTPFAGFIDPRQRWRIWRETRRRHSG